MVIVSIWTSQVESETWLLSVFGPLTSETWLLSVFGPLQSETWLLSVFGPLKSRVRRGYCQY